MNEKEKQAFLTYADAIIAECHRVRFEEGIPGSARYSNMEEKLNDPRQFYVLGHSDGREKMAKELLLVVKTLQSAEEKLSIQVVEHLLMKISKDSRWKLKKN